MRIGFARMKFLLSFVLDGHHHSGIDDCRNIAKICRVLMQRNHDITVPTTRWMPNQLWYDLTRYVSKKQTRTVTNFLVGTRVEAARIFVVPFQRNEAIKEIKI